MKTFEFICPHCKATLEASNDIMGQTLNCPSCNQTIAIPSEESAHEIQNPVTEAETDSQEMEESQTQDTEQEENLQHIKDNFDNDIEDMYMSGEIRRVPGKKIKMQILRIAETLRTQLPDVGSIICDYFPELLTDCGKESFGYYYRVALKAKVEPIIAHYARLTHGRPRQGPLATEKQIAFLRNLGCHDEILLRTINRRQVSELIDALLAAKNEVQQMSELEHTHTETSPTSRKAKLLQKDGCLFLIIIIVATIVIVGIGVMLNK